MSGEDPRYADGETRNLGGGPGSPIANLSALTVLSQNDVSRLSDGPEQIGAVTYQDSAGFTYGNQATAGPG